MQPIPVLGTLILNRGDLLLRLYHSIDYPFDKFVIVNNGKDPGVISACKEIEASNPDHVVIITPPKNTGVAAGWNFIIKSFPAAWHFIVGSDVAFQPGSMEKIVRAAWEGSSKYGKFVARKSDHNAFIITPLAIEKAGYFDENFYPAYLEDCDHQWRMNCTGVERLEVMDCEIIHGEAPTWGSTTIYSNPKYRAMNMFTHQNGFMYYQKKWGGLNDHEVYKHPFNDSRISPKDWVLDPELRAANDVWEI